MRNDDTDFYHIKLYRIVLQPTGTNRISQYVGPTEVHGVSLESLLEYSTCRQSTCWLSLLSGQSRSTTGNRY